MLTLHHVTVQTSGSWALHYWDCFTRFTLTTSKEAIAIEKLTESDEIVQR